MNDIDRDTNMNIRFLNIKLYFISLLDNIWCIIFSRKNLKTTF